MINLMSAMSSALETKNISNERMTDQLVAMLHKQGIRAGQVFTLIHLL